MSISPIFPAHTNTSSLGPNPTENNKTQKQSAKQFLTYASMNALGGIIGFNIPLKDIDGPDVVTGMNGSRKLVMAKTKIPNIVGKYKNALLGCTVGIVLVGLYDYLKSNRRTKKDFIKPASKTTN
jgi:hypothetical protein